MDKEILRLKFLGSLVGQALGDALGAPFEGRERVKQSEVLSEASGHKALIYTDDTHMMMGVAESLIEMRGFDGKHMVYNFIRNFDAEPWRGYGPGPPRIFGLIKSGEAWDKASERLYPGGSYGNGSAMRIAPVGILYHDDPKKLKEVAYNSSQLTHSHNLAKEGAALEAYAVAYATSLLPSSSFNQDEFLAELRQFTEHEVYRKKLGRMESLLGKGDKAEVIRELGNGIEAQSSVPTAIYSFLSHPQSFEEAISFAIALGGDTDTIGAMTGAISGAYLGVRHIPDDWGGKLENRTYIEELAIKLWRMKCG
jgi:poly(ADP-ribose) glycohydrolase ARH3